MDHSIEGLESTISVLSENKISYIGAGYNLSEAQKPYIIEKGGLKIGVYACAEHEFSIAKEYSEFAKKMMPGYIRAFCGQSVIFRILNKLCGHKLKKKISENESLQ